MTMTSGFMAWRVRAVSLHAFAFLEAGTGFRQPEGVGGKALARHVKRGLGAGARFGEEEGRRFSLEDGGLSDWPGVDFVQVCGSIKQVEKFFLRQLVHIQQVFVRPMEGFLLHGGFSGVDVGACRLGRPIAYRQKTEKLKKTPLEQRGIERNRGNAVSDGFGIFVAAKDKEHSASLRWLTFFGRMPTVQYADCPLM